MSYEIGVSGMASLSERARHKAQNDCMVDSAFTEAGKLLNECASALDALSWRGIDTAPKDGTRVFLIAENQIVGKAYRYFLRPFVGYWDAGEWQIDLPFEIRRQVAVNYHPPTHWMPLSEPS